MSKNKELFVTAFALFSMFFGAGNLLLPPLLGYQKMLNFDVTSLPHTGGYLMFVGMSLTVVAFFVGKKEAK